MTTLNAALPTPISTPPLPPPPTPTATASNQWAQMMSDVIWAPGKFFIIHLIVFLSTYIISLYFRFLYLANTRKGTTASTTTGKSQTTGTTGPTISSSTTITTAAATAQQGQQGQ
jgi:hypothetical protein